MIMSTANKHKNYVAILKNKNDLEICEVQDNGFALPVIFINTNLQHWKQAAHKRAGLNFIRDICAILNTPDTIMEKRLEATSLTLHDLNSAFNHSKVDMYDAAQNTSFDIPVIFSDATPEDEDAFFHVLDFYQGTDYRRYKVASLFIPDSFYQQLPNGIDGLLKRYIAHKVCTSSEIAQEWIDNALEQSKTSVPTQQKTPKNRSPKAS